MGIGTPAAPEQRGAGAQAPADQLGGAALAAAQEAADHLGEDALAVAQATADQVGEGGTALAEAHATAGLKGEREVVASLVATANETCEGKLARRERPAYGSRSHDSSRAYCRAPDGNGPVEMRPPGTGAVGQSARWKSLVLSCPLGGCQP
jgi:hypothetical protein